MEATINAQVEKFIQLFGANCDGGCDEDMKKILLDCLKQSGLLTKTPVQVVAASSSATGEKAHRPITGYQLFFSARNKELTPTMKEYSDRQKKISEEWKDEQVKAIWKAKVPVQVKSKSTKEKKLSGYQLFMKEQSKLLKESVKDAKERMKVIGPMWTALSDDDKKALNERAKTWVPTESDSSSASEGEAPVELPPTQVPVPKPASVAPQATPVVPPTQTASVPSTKSKSTKK